MGYYEVSVLITILATSLIAFYLLYKANELNLGILISISIGSIILGFTFGPAFKQILDLFSKRSSINRNIALIFAILAVLVIFLLFILIISIIISLCIPKRIASIDCGVFITKLKTGLSIRDNNLKDKFSVHMKNLTNYVHNLENKLKKPVDTKQIIDKMGIEKNDNINDKQNADITNDVSLNELNTYDELAKEEVVAVIENYEMDTSNELVHDEAEAFIEETEINIPQDSTAEAAQDIIEVNQETTELDQEIIEVNEDITEATDDSKPEDVQVIEESVVDLITEDTQNNLFIDNELYDIVEDDTIATNFGTITEMAIDGTEELPALNIDEEHPQAVIQDEVIESAVDADSLVLKAFECKDDGRKEEAIEYYFKALDFNPDNEMIFWIVLDICTLYKQLGLSNLASSILEGLVHEYGSIIKPEIRDEILFNLKQI